MIIYEAKELARKMEVPQVIIRLNRSPLDDTYRHFITDLLNTRQYDACFYRLIVELEGLGKHKHVSNCHVSVIQ